jgi:hypothetical protein
VSGPGGAGWCLVSHFPENNRSLNEERSYE